VRSLARDALAIVLTGVVLGAAFNQLERASRPPRGLPWIASARPLASVDRLIADAAAGGRPATDAAAAADDAAARSDDAPAPSTGDPPAAAGRTTPAAPPPAPVPLANPAEPDPLPAIPDLGEPLAVELATVTRFVEAGAALIVDAREPAEFAGGHIPGAVNVPYDEAVRDPDLLARLDPADRPVIVYCSGGTCEASRLLAEAMVRDFAMRRVLVYEAGFPEWVAAGRPVAGHLP